MKGGRYFLHEHPAHARLWHLEKVEKLMSEPEVMKATCDQCQYGCEAEDGSPIKKPTRFMTNAPELGAELTSKFHGRSGACGCSEGGVHKQCRGKTARLAAMHHFKLYLAILVGFTRQLKRDGICKDGFVGVLESTMEKTEVQLTST